MNRSRGKHREAFQVDVTSQALGGSFAVRLSGSGVEVDAGECTLNIRGTVRALHNDVDSSTRHAPTCASRALYAIAEALGHLADYTAV